MLPSLWAIEKRNRRQASHAILTICHVNFVRFLTYINLAFQYKILHRATSVGLYLFLLHVLTRGRLSYKR